MNPPPIPFLPEKPSIKGLIIATSGTPDSSGVFFNGNVVEEITSIATHIRAQTSPVPRTMIKFSGSPSFGAKYPIDVILRRYDLVFIVGTAVGSAMLLYRGKMLRGIEELYFGWSSNWGVRVEMRVAESMMGEAKTILENVPWIFFDVVGSVEFTNA